MAIYTIEQEKPNTGESQGSPRHPDKDFQGLLSFYQDILNFKITNHEAICDISWLQGS